MENAVFTKLFIGFFNEINNKNGKVEEAYRTFRAYANSQSDTDKQKEQTVEEWYGKWKRGEILYEPEDDAVRM